MVDIASTDVMNPKSVSFPGNPQTCGPRSLLNSSRQMSYRSLMLSIHQSADVWVKRGRRDGQADRGRSASEEAGPESGRRLACLRK